MTTKVAVTHPFQMLTEAKVAAVIYLWNIGALICCGIDGPPKAEYEINL